jgi:hypothetical protein
MVIVRLPRLRIRTFMLLVVLLALLLWTAMMGLRSFDYSRRASIYRFQERFYREHAQRDLAQGNTGTLEARWGLQIADYYASLEWKYRRAMWRPWIPVEIEPRFFYPAGPPPGEIPQRAPHNR